MCCATGCQIQSNGGLCALQNQAHGSACKIVYMQQNWVHMPAWKMVNTLWRQNHSPVMACIIGEHPEEPCTHACLHDCVYSVKQTLCPCQPTCFAHSSETETGTIAGLQKTTPNHSTTVKFRQQHPQELKQVYH